MPIMTWDQSLDVGVVAMNREHREILDAMNKIYDAHSAGQKGDTINRLVAALGQVCVKHFADEEKFMAEIEFPGLSTHRHIHQKLLDDFTRYAGAIKAAGGVANDEFFAFLKRWLLAHIKGIDTKYGEHANRKASVA